MFELYGEEKRKKNIDKVLILKNLYINKIELNILHEMEGERGDK